MHMFTNKKSPKMYEIRERGIIYFTKVSEAGFPESLLTLRRS